MKKWQVGDVGITKIVEMETVGGASWILPDATPEAVRDIDGQVHVDVHVVRRVAPILVLVATEAQRLQIKDNVDQLNLHRLNVLELVS